MKKFNSISLHPSIIILVSFLICSHILVAQEENESISVYQYRKVQNDKIQEFVERETKYWSKVAQKAIDEGKLQFWALLEKVGGIDLDNSSNFLFVNTFPDIDNVSGIWNATAVFPDVPLEDMETFSISRNTAMIFVKSHYWEEVSNADPENDYKYINMVYHNADNPVRLIEAEKEVWAPFIKSAMDNGKTTQKAWGNARILSPTGPEINYNTISFDLYPSLKEALDPSWSGDLEIPDMTPIFEAEGNRRASVIYRIIHVVSAN